MNKIPIVLASDKNCDMQMYITILSAITNKKKDSFYDFYCLIPSRFSKFVDQKFKKLINKYNNVKLTFISMKNTFSHLPMQIEHITSPTFYRLKIAELLPGYDKALYLDIDTIVLKDLTQLFNTDLGNNYIGGVPAASYIIEYEKLKDYYDNIGLKDMAYYVNAGVILWNLKQIRQDNVTEKFLALTKNTYKFMDQDIINLVCYGKIKHLDFKYNVMTSYKRRFLDNPELCNKIYEIYGEANLRNAIKNPVIVHYASDLKPWIDKKVWLGNYWLNYAKKAPAKIKIKESSCTRFLKQISENKFKKLVFWGASIFLKDLIETKKIKRHKILGIIDADPSKHGKKIGDFQIYSPQELNVLKPDAVIFAIRNRNEDIYPQVQGIIKREYPNIKILPNIFCINKNTTKLPKGIIKNEICKNETNV